MKRASELVYDFVSVCREEADGEMVPNRQYMREGYATKASRHKMIPKD